MSDMNVDRRMLIAGVGLVGATMIARRAAAGPLDPPPGPVSPTGKTVQEIYDRIARTPVGIAEPRIPLQSLPGSATALHVISQPGSYYLTGNIQGIAGRNGVEIRADNVSLDLGGFSMVGVSGALAAIRIDNGGPMRQVHVANGSLRLWPGGGAIAPQGFNSSLRFIHVFQCNNDPLHLRHDSVIADCVATSCNGPIFVGDRGNIARCVSNGNDPGGFFLIRDGLIVDSEVVGANGAGYIIQEGGHIARCTARFCSTGYHLNAGAALLECSGLNCGIGVLPTNGNCRIQDCHFAFCSEAGVDVVDSFNNGGTVVDGVSAVRSGIGIRVRAGTTGNFIRRCVARGNTGGNYSISPGNSHGPIVNVAGLGDISSVPNANHPWANFIY